MTRNIPEHAIFFINGKRKMKLKLQLNFIKNTIRKITELLFGMCKNSIFRSQAYTRKGSLEVTFFRTYVYPYVFVCPRILRNSIFCKIELWDTSSVHKWGPSLLEVNRKWTGSGKRGCLCPAIFFITHWVKQSGHQYGCLHANHHSSF